LRFCSGLIYGMAAGVHLQPCRCFPKLMVGENPWAHLTPLDQSRAKSLKSVIGKRVASAIRSMQMHGSNLVRYYRLQSTLHGTTYAVRDTTYNAARVLKRVTLSRPQSRDFSGWVRDGFANSSVDWGVNATPIDDIVVSVVIPTKNAGSGFRLLLAMLRK